MKSDKKTKKVNFSSGTIKRLSLYLRKLRNLQEEDINIISSKTITQFLDVKPDQFRKDLSYFGEFGKRGVGYDAARLIKEIEDILGISHEWKIALVGVGRLGSALLGFKGFSKFNLKITCAFDVEKSKIGKIKGGIKIKHIKDLENTVKKQGVKIAVIATSSEAAQNIADKLVASGIKGIFNFAPVFLKISKDVVVSNMDMACELENLVFFVKKQSI